MQYSVTPPEPKGQETEVRTARALFMNQRQILRKNIRTQRQQLSLTQQQLATQKITARLTEQTIFQNSKLIATYSAINGEIATTALLQLAKQHNKTYFLPVLEPQQTLKFVRYFIGDTLALNQFNILEPVISAEKIISPQDLEVVLVPLLAFDITGNRLGMGAGYYDRTFAFRLLNKPQKKPYLIGLAYEFQKVRSIPAAEWDVPLDAVVTDENFYLF